eukprot:jgi/Picsp_1/1972/NSC_05438-R1_protein
MRKMVHGCGLECGKVTWGWTRVSNSRMCCILAVGRDKQARVDKRRMDLSCIGRCRGIASRRWAYSDDKGGGFAGESGKEEQPVLGDGPLGGASEEPVGVRPGRKSLLPAGKKQARLEIPGIFVKVEPGDVVDGRALEDIVEAVRQGVSGVIIGGEGNAGNMYNSILALKEAVEGQAMLIVEDRSDIADAVGVDGVLVSSTGLPIVVTKNSLKDAGSVVGKSVGSGEEARQAAFEGAGFLVVQAAGAEVANVNVGATSGVPARLLVESARQQMSGSSVVLLGQVERVEWDKALEDAECVGALGNMDGVVMPLGDLLSLRDFGERTGKDLKAMISHVKDLILDTKNLEKGDESQEESERKVAQVSDILSQSREKMIESQKESLLPLIQFLEDSCPALDEVSILKDSLKQLDELFLVVVVGEFNSGKSAVVNALLGGDIVPEGILPTTNEITVMKWADLKHGEERVEQESDGMFIRYANADLLKEINIVDTPGTNVILERQQRLTEEFIPRADLVLFVLSADRPFTDSEVKFLKYVREWGKKVVFVVNKIDLLANDLEVNEVREFVENNAKRLLGVDGAKAIPVSAKRATEAKIESRYIQGDTSAGVLTAQEEEYLSGSQKWRSSRFEDLESHMRDFLLGTTPDSGGSESLVLKLQTPLFVAAALIDASRAQVEAELDVLQKDAESISLVTSQMQSFKEEMQKEGKIQKSEVKNQVDRMFGMIGSIIDGVMQLSNWQTLVPYLDSRKKTRAAASILYNQDISQDAIKRVNSILEEHAGWLNVNCKRVEENYRQFVEERLEAFGQGPNLQKKEPSSSSEDERRQWRDSRKAEVGQEMDALAQGQVDIDLESVAFLIETEIQQAVLSSASTAGSAGGLALVLTYILPTTLEDLLALGLSAAVGYTSLLNIPVRRMEAKKKIRSQLDAIVQGIHNDMDREREKALRDCDQTVSDMLAPLDTHVKSELLRLESCLAQLIEYSNQVDGMKKQVMKMR